MAKSKSKPKSKLKSTPKAKPKINSKSKSQSQSKAKTAKPKKQAAAKTKNAAKKAVKKVGAAKTSGGKTSSKTAPKTAAKSAKNVKSNKKASSNLQAKPKATSVSKASHVRTEASVDGVFTPLDDRVMIERAGVADRTPGGLYIPDTVADRPNRGKVIAVGRGHRDKKGRVRPLDVEKGDEVLFSAFAGSEITISNRDFLILREDEIIAVVK